MRFCHWNLSLFILFCFVYHRVLMRRILSWRTYSPFLGGSVGNNFETLFERSAICLWTGNFVIVDYFAVHDLEAFADLSSHNAFSCPLWPSRFVLIQRDIRPKQPIQPFRVFWRLLASQPPDNLHFPSCFTISRNFYSANHDVELGLRLSPRQEDSASRNSNLGLECCSSSEWGFVEPRHRHFVSCWQSNGVLA